MTYAPILFSVFYRCLLGERHERLHNKQINTGGVPILTHLSNGLHCLLNPVLWHAFFTPFQCTKLQCLGAHEK